jgi:hypothetical protein
MTRIYGRSAGDESFRTSTVGELHDALNGSNRRGTSWNVAVRMLRPGTAGEEVAWLDTTKTALMRSLRRQPHSRKLTAIVNPWLASVLVMP